MEEALENIETDGIQRLETEVIEMNNMNVAKIFDYLKTRPEMQEKFNNKEKSIKQMYQYICDKAQKQAQDNVAMVDDKIVYIWAMTYFNRSNEDLGLNKKPEPPKKIETKKEEQKAEIKQEENKEDPAQMSMF